MPAGQHRPGRSAVLAIVLLVAGCSHTDAFGPTPGERGPFEFQPERLTFNIRADVAHGYSAQGDELFYTYCADAKTELVPPCGEVHQPDLPVAAGDVCLGALPAEGGGRVVELCGTPVADQDSLKQFLTGTRLADGTLAYIYSTRRTTASFSVNPALYLWPPTASSPIRALEYHAKPQDAGIPTQLIAAGGMRLASLGGDGPELLTVQPDQTVTREAMPGLVAADARSGQVLLSSGEVLQVRDLETGTTVEVGRIAQGGSTLPPVLLRAGLAAGAAFVVQQSWPPTMDSAGVVHLLRFRSGTAADTLLAGDASSLSSLAVAPDGRSVIYGDGGDLYRIVLGT